MDEDNLFASLLREAQARRDDVQRQLGVQALAIGGLLKELGVTEFYLTEKRIDELQGLHVHVSGHPAVGKGARISLEPPQGEKAQEENAQASYGGDTTE